MTNPRLLLGVDISTTGAKALLIDQNGEVLTSATTPLSLQTPFPLWSEQDPEEWWQGIKTSIQKVLTERDSAGIHRRDRADRPDARPGDAG